MIYHQIQEAIIARQIMLHFRCYDMYEDHGICAPSSARHIGIGRVGDDL